jgi:hypothetical protein
LIPGTAADEFLAAKCRWPHFYPTKRLGEKAGYSRIATKIFRATFFDSSDQGEGM